MDIRIKYKKKEIEIMNRIWFQSLVSKAYNLSWVLSTLCLFWNGLLINALEATTYFYCDLDYVFLSIFILSWPTTN